MILSPQVGWPVGQLKFSDVWRKTSADGTLAVHSEFIRCPSSIMLAIPFSRRCIMDCQSVSTRTLSGLPTVLLLVAAVILTVSPSLGQTEPAVDTSSPPPTKAPDEFRFTVAWVSASGGYLYVPEKWAELRINLVNARDVPRDLICSTYFSNQPNLQYGRRVWLPAQSVMHISHPVVIPPCNPDQGRGLNLQSLIVDATEGGDVLVKSNSGQLLHDSSLLVTLMPRNTGIIGRVPELDQKPALEDESELVIAGRVSQQLSNKLGLMIDTFLPADESEWNSFDHIVITENRIQNDFAALSALRHWMHAGGHLWVMLDQADPTVLERLLGDDFRGHVIDRVGLTTVRVDKATSVSDPNGDLGESFDFEEPIEFVRMVASNMEVTYVVNGWPAAMTKPCGDGRLLITTLGSRGWMTPISPRARQSPDPTMTARFVPTSPMLNIASEFFGQREPDLVTQTSLEPQAREYIGYTIPSWGLIVGTLMGFSALLVAVAFGLLRSGRLESLGWIGSLMAIAVSVGLLSIGHLYRHGIPGTVATIQMAEAMIGTDDVRIHGVVAVYQPDGSQSPIQVTGGGRMLPDMSGQENSPRRMVTTDLGKWHWENLAQPAGLRTTEFTSAETRADRIEARATLTASGMEGNLSGNLPSIADALIATRSGRLGVTFNENGTFTARAGDLFEKDQYLSTSLISDEQDRRRRTMEKVLANPNRKDYPDRPQLMFWTDRWEHGFQFEEKDRLKSQGATLVAIPLIIDRPPNGTEIVIPSPLLPYRNRRDPNGNPPSTMWNYGRNEWQERSTPGTAWLSIQVPQELLPAEASRARIEIKVSGPVGRIEILGVKNGKIETAETVKDPVGTISIDVNDPDLLSIAATGELTLGINAGDPDRPELTQTSPSESERSSGKRNANAKVNYWKIESLTVQLWVKTTEPTAKE